MDTKFPDEIPEKRRHRGGVCHACGVSLAGNYGTSGLCDACLSGPKPRPIPGFRLAGEDGNAFSIMGRFQRAARRHGSDQKPFLTKEEISAVMTAAQSGDYDHLLQVFIPWDGDGEEGDDE